jgi:DNA polymerase-3 subunit alpha
MHKECFREDELLIAKVQTKVQPATENFAGNTRHIVHSAMNIATARLRYAHSARFQLNAQIDVRKLNEKSQTFFRQVNSMRTNTMKTMPEGLVLTAELSFQGGQCEVEFPPSWKLYPDQSYYSRGSIIYYTN